VRTARELALSALCAAVIVGVVTTSRVTLADEAVPPPTQATTPPTWTPPPPIAPIFGVTPAPATTPVLAPRPPDRRLHDSDLALRLGFAAGFAPTNTLDGALTARGYDASLAMPVFDLTLTARTVWWLFLGARVGTRWRPIEPPFGAHGRERVDAAGVDALFIAELRAPLGPFEITPELGLGVAYAEVLQGGLAITRATPRVTVGLGVSVWVVDPLRLVARIGWDLYRLADINDFGHALSIGGPSVGGGLEWRPR
jgi:hypothetical protein